jgi:DNA-binding response OmpR family regulator
MKVLMVEDDMFLREMYAYVFRQEQHEFIEAADGADGLLKATQQGPFDIILLDVMLPKMNGVDILRELRKPESPAAKTPILMLSNLGQDSVIQESFSLGADGYIIKADLLPRQVYEKVRDFLAGTITKEELRTSKSVE